MQGHDPYSIISEIRRPPRRDSWRGVALVWAAGLALAVFCHIMGWR